MNTGRKQYSCCPPPPPPPFPLGAVSKQGYKTANQELLLNLSGEMLQTFKCWPGGFQGSAKLTAGVATMRCHGNGDSASRGQVYDVQ